MHDEGTDGIEVNKLFQKDTPKCIQKVLKEYSDVFLVDLPLGLPPIRQGHEFKVDLEDDQPPVHRPLYKLSPFELKEEKSRLNICSSMGSSEHWTHPMAHPFCLHQRKMEDYAFALIIGG